MLSELNIENTLGLPLIRSKKLAVALIDTKLKFAYVNDTFYNITGYTEQDILNKSVTKFLAPSLIKEAWQEFFFFLGNGYNNRSNWIFSHKDGSHIHASVENSKIKIGKKTYILTIALNVTPLTELRERLLETQQLLNRTEGISKSGSFKYNPDIEQLIWSEGMFSLFELDPQNGIPSISQQVTLLSEEDAKQYKNVLNSNSGKDADFELCLNFEGNRQKYLHIICHREKGKGNWIFGYSRDITQQKLTELETYDKERKYRTLTESLPSIIWTANHEGYLNYMNRYGLDYFGKEGTTLEEWRWKNFIHPNEIREADQQWFKALEEQQFLSGINRLKARDGEYKWFQVLIVPQKNELNEIEAWTGIATDIDKRVKAEESLSISNTRLKALINASPVAIYSITVDGVVRDFWNPAAEELFGWTREEVIGKFLPHVYMDQQQEFMEMLENAVKNGAFNKRIHRKDRSGTSVITDITGGCIYDENSKISEIIVTVSDVTELERNRKRLQKSLDEKETLLQEIHHRVKNNLAIVVSLLQLQVFRSENAKEKNSLLEAQNRIISISMVHELLYKSEDFNSVKLDEYYNELFRQISNNMQLNHTNIKQDLAISIHSLNMNQAIPLGLLINELATNSYKYAFGDSTKPGVIFLEIKRVDNNVHVTYRDNGPGFNMGLDGIKSGLGMKIIESLLQQLDAEYSMNSDGLFEITFNFAERLNNSLEN
ncbi:MAG: PAS domain S-box protein [Balneola sp.]|nr:MAG: PAS domain S-box protein [Balneola sp.]